jgi:hypothetical protein
MQKEQYILKGKPGEDYHVFGSRMLGFARTLSGESAPGSLKITLTTRKPPAFSVIPFRGERTALLSVTGADDRLREIISGAEGFRGGYLVEEAVPLAYQKTWDDRDPTPGVCLLTLFHRKPGLNQELFIRRWHEGHTALSLRLHPLWNYNRNVVKEAVVDGPDWYDGIVEEQFRSAPELLNPLRFFGPPLRVPKHMIEVYRDTRSFIDMKRIETYLATEYHIRS